MVALVVGNPPALFCIQVSKSKRIPETSFIYNEEYLISQKYFRTAPTC